MRQRDAPAPDRGRSGRVAYVLKMYPRFSETFIVNEILAHEAAGVDLRIVSLRPPTDGRFHPALAEVRAPVTYLDHRGLRSSSLWDLLRRRSVEGRDLADVLPQLLAADVGDAVQALELAELAERDGIDHLHAHFGSVATTVARLASLLTGIPYSFTAHAKDIFHDDVDDRDLGTKIDDAATCITVSDFNARHLRRLTEHPSRITRVYNGLHLDRFPFDDRGERPPSVIAVGRLVEKKGFADLVSAVRLIRERGRDVTCRIVGSGPLEGALRDQVDAADLGDVVELTGPLPQHAVADAVRSASVMVAPCVVGDDGNRDGMPTVLLEAMALGTPCIATPVTGVPELIRHGHNGVLVPERDPGALATEILTLIDDTERRRALAHEARRTIEADFDIVRQAAQLRRCFRTDRTDWREAG